MAGIRYNAAKSGRFYRCISGAITNLTKAASLLSLVETIDFPKSEVGKKNFPTTSKNINSYRCRIEKLEKNIETISGTVSEKIDEYERAQEKIKRQILSSKDLNWSPSYMRGKQRKKY